MKKTKVSIGIPAYNEETNIANAIMSVLKQENDNFILVEVVVLSDGSSDNTNRIVKSLANKKIKLVTGYQRKGKSYRLNQFFSMINSEMAILLDADCVIESDAIYQIVKSHQQSKKVSYFGANCKSLPATNPVQWILSAGVAVNKRMSDSYLNGNNVYSFRGALVGIRKDLYSQVKMPSTVGTDAYLYFLAKKLNLKTVYVKKAVAYYSLPVAIWGHVKQSTRFLNSKIAMKTYFGDMTSVHYRLPKRLIVKSLFSQFIHGPFSITVYVLLSMYVHIRFKNEDKNISGIWNISQSTKSPINKIAL